MNAKNRNMHLQSELLFTGGGTGGHVFPGLAIIYSLYAEVLKEPTSKIKNTIVWVGSHNGPERQFLVQEDIPFYQISTGKFRRYFSIKNFFDPINIIRGLFQSRKILKTNRPKVVVSIGGFVSVPVVLAARTLGIPVVSMCCDISLGLATKINFLCSSILFCSYEETLNQLIDIPLYRTLQKIRTLLCNKYVAKNLISMPTFSQKNNTGQNVQSQDNGITINICLGTPIRKEVYNGDADIVTTKMQIPKDKTMVLFLGGSKGANQINDLVLRILPRLTEQYVVVHQTGLREQEGTDEVSIRHRQVSEETATSTSFIHTADNLQNIACQYFSYNFITSEYPNFLARANIAVARAGSGTVWELVANLIPTALIPLSKEQSRGDQIENARYFANRGMVKNFGTNPSDEEILAFLETLAEDATQKRTYQNACKEFAANQSAKYIAEYIHCVFLVKK